MKSTISTLAMAVGLALLATFMYHVTAAPIEVVQGPQPEDPVLTCVEPEPEVTLVSLWVVDTPVEKPTPTYTEAELDALALVIYQEAGADAYTDEIRQMVGEVALNRVADDRFPATLEAVLTEVTASGYGAYGRLHWTGLVWPERAGYASEAHAVERAYNIAEKLLSGSVERLLPEDTVFQAEFEQGVETVKDIGGFYFCR